MQQSRDVQVLCVYASVYVCTDLLEGVGVCVVQGGGKGVIPVAVINKEK